MCHSNEDDERIANDERLNNTERDLKNELLITRKTRDGILTNDDWEQQIKRNEKSKSIEDKLQKLREQIS